jgi:hypothetical protein
MRKPYELSLHQGQLELYRCKAKTRVAVCGRRFGKSRLAVVEMALDSLNFPGLLDKLNPPVVLGVLPTLKQAKKILWNPLVSLFTETELKQAVQKINKSEMTIQLKGRPSIVIAGANDSDGDRIRGLRVYSLKADEYQDWKPGIRENVLEPALADTPGSRALYTGTPKGKLNHLYKLYQEGQTDLGDVRSFNFPSSINPSKSLQQAIGKARGTLPPRVYRQEFEATFEDFPGKIYHELGDANICNMVPERLDTVVFGVDWGDVYPAIVALGRSGETWYYLDGWCPDLGVPVPQPAFDEVLINLATKWQPKVVYCDPSRPSSILGVRELGRKHNLVGLVKAVQGYNPIEEGITQVHSLIYQLKLRFPKFATCHPPGYKDGLAAFELMSSYHRDTDNLGNVTEKVEDGQPDHICDALRYALAMRSGKI